jgi:hypothetical protein
MAEYISVNDLLQNYERGKKVCVWGCGYLAKTTCKDVLHKLNIIPYCFCDSNKDLYGSVIYDDIKCVDYGSLNLRDDEVVWIICVRFPIQDEIYSKLVSLGYSSIIPITSLSCDPIVIRKYFPFMESKIVAYTCIVGNYDKIHYPSEELSQKYDYVLISDEKPSDMGTFKQWIDVRDVCPIEITDNARRNRYCKINAHKIFPNYNMSIYMDGNIQLKRNLDEICNNIPPIGVIVLAHTGYKDIYCEAAHKMGQNVDNVDIIYQQIKKYWKDGCPQNFGSWHCGLMLRKHNSIICKKIMEEWWEEINSYSKRDQLSFPYVLWKNNYDANIVKTVLSNSENIEKSEYFCFFDDHFRK